MAAEMCPHCGELVGLGRERLTLPHELLGAPCPGSEQNPRNAESDGRRLWNGKLNRFFRGGDHAPPGPAGPT